MPELPEVETIVNDLRKKVLNRTFLDIWTDAKKIIKRTDFENFKRNLKNKKISVVRRRAKNIIFDLSGEYSLLVHLKMTGHLLVGKWKLVDGKWQAGKKGVLQEKVNGYIHIMFWLSGDLMLALSDLRKFAKVELWKTKELENSTEFKALGPEPLEKYFTFEKFKEVLQKKNGKIKQVLMDQSVVSGIGNIYADEILWESKINPLKKNPDLKNGELQKIYLNIKKILKKAIKLRGTSISDYRDPQGKEGFFAKARKAYQREGEKCQRCGTAIKRIKIGGRSAHFCPKCQKYAR